MISDPIFVFTTNRSNCVAYPFILQASNQPGFATSDFETVWILTRVSGSTFWKNCKLAAGLLNSICVVVTCMLAPAYTQFIIELKTGFTVFNVTRNGSDRNTAYVIEDLSSR